MADTPGDSTHEDWSRDPGWRLGWRLLLLVIPGVLQREAKRNSGDPLALLRDVALSFMLAIVFMGIPLSFLPPDQQGSAWVSVGTVLGVALIAFVAPRVIERPLDCSSDLSLIGSYRARFFIRVAFAESIALVSFVLHFVSGPSWIYFLGGGIALIRMASRAPTPAALIRDQDELTARGCGRSLVAAFRHPQPG